MPTSALLLVLGVAIVTFQFAEADGTEKKRAPGDAPKTVAELISDLKGSDDDRENATILLGLLGAKAKEAVPALRVVMKHDPHPMLRLQAAWAMAKVAPAQAKDAVRTLTDGLSWESAPAVETEKTFAIANPASAVLMLATLGPAASDAAPALRKIASPTSKKPELRLFAEAALVHIDSGRMEKAVAVLERAWLKSLREQAWDEADPIMAGLAFFAIESSEALHIVLQALKNPKAEVRSVAADYACDIIGPGTTHIIPALEAILFDPDKDVAVMAAGDLLLLNSSNTTKVTASLKKSLGDTDGRIRNLAVRCIPCAGPQARVALRELIPTLRSLAQKDPGEDTRKQAQIAVAFIESDTARLRAIAQDDPNMALRGQAERALTSLARGTAKRPRASGSR